MLSRWSIAETVSRRQLVGTVLIVLGAVANFAGELGATLIGVAASIVALVANAAVSLMGRSVNRDGRLTPLTVTVTSLIVWLAVVNTAWAFTLWNTSLRRLAAVESAALNTTMLVQIAVLAWVFLGQAPGVMGLLGIVVVSVGVLIAQDLSFTWAAWRETRA